MQIVIPESFNINLNDLQSIEIEASQILYENPSYPEVKTLADMLDILVQQISGN